MSMPASAGARRFTDPDQAASLAAWCGGTAYADDSCTDCVRLPDGTHAMPGDWIIRRADRTFTASPDLPPGELGARKLADFYPAAAHSFSDDWDL